ncbi:MAG: replication-associated recombination protein A [Clostridia bacterium]|nr:replication-associated recombination protein A [Clostridia bacterium]MBQ8637386.1 replication-associated recombination protein A [Clostridia bacterium]
MKSPLADRIRPTVISEVAGQKHLLGEGKLLRRLIDGPCEIPNMIFYGPSGVGKTTVANILAAKTGKTLHRLNATTASVSDVKDIISSLDGFLSPDGVLLYLDEIQHFNKKQQQSLLEFMENGRITLIASTTENPYFYVYNAVLSRSVVFEFLPLDASDIAVALNNAVLRLSETDYAGLNLNITPEAIAHMSESAAGDVRKALNSLEISLMGAVSDKSGTLTVDLELAEQATQKKALRHDKDGDSHYDLLSAFHKSIRGSDPDAAVYYLARLLSGGDMQGAMRRLLAIASEDVGLAYPQAVSIVKSCCDSALQLGMPEAKLPLTQAAILLATAPKSNSVVMAIDAAMADIETTDTGDIPLTLKDTHYSGATNLGRGGYVYPHPYPNHWVDQQYLPDKIRDKIYYEYGDNKTEQAAKSYWQKIKEGKDECIAENADKTSKT